MQSRTLGRSGASASMSSSVRRSAAWRTTPTRSRPCLAQRPVEREGVVGRARVLHVDPDEDPPGVRRRARARRRACGRARVELEPEPGQLDRDVGVEAIGLDRLQRSVVALRDRLGLVGLGDLLAEDVDRRAHARGVEPRHDAAGVVERRPCDVRSRDAPHDRARDGRQDADDRAVEALSPGRDSKAGLAHEALAGGGDERDRLREEHAHRVAKRERLLLGVPPGWICASAAAVSSTAVESVSVANCSRCASLTPSACCSANSRRPPQDLLRVAAEREEATAFHAVRVATRGSRALDVRPTAASATADGAPHRRGERGRRVPSSASSSRRVAAPIASSRPGWPGAAARRARAAGQRRLLGLSIPSGALGRCAGRGAARELVEIAGDADLDGDLAERGDRDRVAYLAAVAGGCPRRRARARSGRRPARRRRGRCGRPTPARPRGRR